MKKIIRLTERDLTRIVKRVIREQGPFAPGMGPSSKSTTPRGVNPGMKKPNLQPLPKINFKIGDVYEFDWSEDDATLKFKVKSISKNNEGEMRVNGTVVSVDGEILPDDYNKEYYRKVKVGDPISLWNIDDDSFSFDLLKTFGEMDMASNMTDLTKLN